MKEIPPFWANQTRIAKEFGISTHALRKILVENGLMYEEFYYPTDDAFEAKFAKITILPGNKRGPIWNLGEICELIEYNLNLSPYIYTWTNQLIRTFMDDYYLRDIEYIPEMYNIGHLMELCDTELDMPKDLWNEAVTKAYHRLVVIWSESDERKKLLERETREAIKDQVV